MKLHQVDLKKALLVMKSSSILTNFYEFQVNKCFQLQMMNVEICTTRNSSIDVDECNYLASINIPKLNAESSQKHSKVLL